MAPLDFSTPTLQKPIRMSRKRRPEVVVISDLHLGTYGCHARELLHYLKSIRPKVLVLNGDIIDIWPFSKRYWPKSHMKVIRHLAGWAGKDVQIYYIPGNHDETLRRFAGFSLGSFHIVNKVVLTLSNGQKAWCFHGDVFDVTMQHAKWLARLGAIGYDILILINRLVNFISERLAGGGRISLSKKVKDKVKSAVAFINRFEETAASIGIEQGYPYVVCGHIHQPVIRTYTNSKGSTTYLNSGDWIENLSALEFDGSEWRLYRFSEQDARQMKAAPDEEQEPGARELFDHLLSEFNLRTAL